MFLNCHTGYSFKYGTLRPEELFSEARRCGVRKLAITEINNTASYMEMLRICHDHTRFNNDGYDLELAVGIEFRRDDELLYVAIARNNNGFAHINRFLSIHNRDAKPLPDRPAELEDAFIIYPFGKIAAGSLRPNEYLGVRTNQLNQFTLHSATDFLSRFVILQPVTVLPPANADDKTSNVDYNAHRLLRAVARNTLLSKLPEHVQARPDEYMTPEQVVEKKFVAFPFLINNTRALLDQCSFDLRPAIPRNKRSVTGSGESDIAYLKAETEKGFVRVYGPNNAHVWQRIQRELEVIARKEFTAYYLVAYDLIRFAQSKGFDYVGRGSGANSAVAYCLGITNVDPIELNLYFERFLNEERTSPPDFDIDFSWDNRDAIYDYLFSRYGHDHVCLLGTHVTYQSRSIHRDLGKVFGLPKEELDELVEDPVRQRDRDHITRLVCRYASYIMEKELPSNMSIHAGGVLITEEPIYCYTATEAPPKGYPVSHFEMHAAEDFGIYKFDILSQRGLGHIKEAVRLIKRNRNVEVNIRRFDEFKKDEAIKKLLRTGKTMGCFYVESPGMRVLLGKLRCDDYVTLVAASSIIRPGVASSGMMRTYIERFHAVRDGGTYEVLHPRMRELMEETYGVMVYQEDVIKVAHEFAGLTLTEADVLRRGMSGKYRSREEFRRVKERFFEECDKKGYARAVSERVWYEIESFSGYSFAKGHSASYAVESYQSLFLKAHFPLEFMVAVINNFGGFYKTEFYFHEARMNGAKIEPPCVNTSEYYTTLVDDRIYVGFIHIKGLDVKVMGAIAPEQKRGGPFRSLPDFLARVAIGIEQLRLLIRIGAFRFTGKSKPRLLWEGMLYYSNARRRERSPDLFSTEPKEYPLPALTRGNAEDAFDELELLGFPLGNPFALLGPASSGDSLAVDLVNRVGKSVHIIGYVVTTKDARTKNRDTMHFGTFLDAEGNVFDTVHFPAVNKKFPFRGRGFYRIKGIVTSDFGIVAIEVSMMEKLSMVHKRADEFLREAAVSAGPGQRSPSSSGHTFFTNEVHR